MVKSLEKSIINVYSMGACAALGISNQDAFNEDLENDPFLNSPLERFTCELYYRFCSFLAPLSIGIIMSRHYLWGRCMTPGPQGPSEHNKNGERTSGTSATRCADRGPLGGVQGSAGHPAIRGEERTVE